MILTENLAYQYPKGASFVFPNLHCLEGEHHLILGPSGSGKSTLLHLLAALLKPSNGKLELHGEAYGYLSASAADAFRGQYIGMIFQKSYFIASLTVAENLGIAQRLGGQRVDKKANIHLLETLGIAQHANKRADQLSVGEQQRASIARGLVNRPKLLLADEPTAALDADNARIVSQLLRERATELGAVLLVVTHDERLLGDFPAVLRIGEKSLQN